MPPKSERGPGVSPPPRSLWSSRSLSSSCGADIQHTLARTGQARKEEPLPDIVTPKEPSLAGQSRRLPPASSHCSEEECAPPL